jgi:hypothetical protein
MIREIPTSSKILMISRLRRKKKGRHKRRIPRSSTKFRTFIRTISASVNRVRADRLDRIERGIASIVCFEHSEHRSTPSPLLFKDLFHMIFKRVEMLTKFVIQTSLQDHLIIKWYGTCFCSNTSFPLFLTEHVDASPAPLSCSSRRIGLNAEGG